MRTLPITSKSKCCGCALCAHVCPSDAIIMKNDKHGFYYPVINSKKCISCGKCHLLCPALVSRNIDVDPQVYGAYSAEDEDRKKSSSGGIAYLLGKKVIESNGVVYGAVLENMICRHKRVDSIRELELLRKSKYIQSDMSNVYSNIQADVTMKHFVLFTGTPCQCAAIHRLIGNSPFLITAEVICHGVPSQALFSEYIKNEEIKSQKKITGFEFRYKKSSFDWSNFLFCCQYEDGSIYSGSYREFAYGIGFLKNLILRPCCYECQYLSFSSGADLSLMDFWSVDKVRPAFYDQKGCSCVSINSEKGKYLFNYIECEKTTIDPITLGKINKVYQSSTPHPLTKKFYKECSSLDEQLKSINIYLNTRVNHKELGLWGSYNARVAIKETCNNLTWQYSYSSLISLMSPAILPCNLNDSFNDSDFHQIMQFHDRNRTFINQIEHTIHSIDFLVIDLLEERLLTKTSHGIRYTSDIDLCMLNQAMLPDLDSVFLQWSICAARFIDMLLQHIEPDRIIVICSKLATGYGLHGPYHPYENKSSIVFVNSYLEKCYDYFIKRAGITHYISIPDQLNYTMKYHRYGRFPYHLNYDAYQKIARQIEDIV